MIEWVVAVQETCCLIDRLTSLHGPGMCPFSSKWIIGYTAVGAPCPVSPRAGERLSKKQKKKRRQKAQEQGEDAEDTDLLTQKLGGLQMTNDDDDDEASRRSAKSKRSRRKEKKNAAASAAEEEIRETVPLAEAGDEPADDPVTQAPNGDDTDLTKSAPSQPEDGETASKETKPKQDTTEYVSRAKAAKVKESLTCAVCRQLFSSRNKLFEHIKATGHAIPLSAKQAATTVETTETGKKKNKRKGKQ
ncbi:hypothetical protein BaRGS_00006553 [Batillaria attramentaria]|uniref:C2H2-type domain-containing protein n=1 Tax=Batillaria attramentaria TaxID=370345 RepID=A0ABD0LR64_9CAEN